jgi:type III restriction enzyme
LLQLHEYQQQSLDALAEYLRLTVERENADTAFYEMTGRPYRKVPGLEPMPYVCLRVPTGGGKTFMACHALGLVARDYLRVERTLCLWLVPSNAIREQTLNALRNRRHPYRLALDNDFGGRVSVMDLSEALYLQRGTLASDTAIVVTTLQSLRVEDTDGRKVYETNGALEHHFDVLDPMQRAVLETESEGAVIYSLANVLRLHRPVAIMDEAHNARTKLTFATLTRFFPAGIVEFTATPETKHQPSKGRFASNVLHHVSARELKEAHMVKLPIKLRTGSDWRTIVRDALDTEEELRKLAAKEAKATGEPIRPMVLFQAESVTRDDVNVDVLKEELISEFGVPEDTIAIATGSTRELDDLDLFHPDCPIRYIITVKALAEGWDCSFAYILCSLSGISTPRAVEQILGRILRLPNAREKQHEELNCAYALAASEDFYQAAMSLRDALIEGAGFQAMEAEDFVQGTQQPELPLFRGGAVAERRERREPSTPFAIPLLGVRVGKQLRLFEHDRLVAGDWDLTSCDATLTEDEFPSALERMETGELDADEDGQIQVSFVKELHRQLSFADVARGWTLPTLVAWLDHHTAHRFVPARQSAPFIDKVVFGLTESRGLSLDQLVRDRFRLAEAIERKMLDHYRAAAAKGFQQLLLDPADLDVEVSAELALAMEEDDYAPNQYYEHPEQFPKHLFPVIGDMNREEVACAQWLENCDDVEVWVRNLERKENSFWLQTSTDKFYPDFLARLTDGRYLVVEYKSVHGWSNDDSKEKRRIGAVWEAQSGGQCLFVMPKGEDWSAIQAKISGA